jgi:thiamine biosynthesis lipoprotein ApbE
MSTPAPTITRAHWQALGTSVDLLLSDAGLIDEARAIVERQLEEVDRACSRFREDSELSRVNAQAGRTVAVGPLLIEAVELALRAAELTDGDVDPTIGSALALAGYDRDWSLLARRTDELLASPSDKPGAPPLVRVSVRSGWRTIQLDRGRGTLRVPGGVRLDLGATAKAWAADRASRAVHEKTGCGVLVSLGGDISTAGPCPSAGWPVHVTDDHRSAPDAPGQTVSIAGGGLATSSTTVRRWCRRGHTMHHIIDPSSGSPAAEVWRTVSIAARDCADANIAATAAIVRGSRAPEWLIELGLPARLVTHDGNVLTLGAWPDQSDQP